MKIAVESVRHMCPLRSSFFLLLVLSRTTVTGVQESWLWVDHQLVKNKNNNVLEAQNVFQKIIGTLSK